MDFHKNVGGTADRNSSLIAIAIGDFLFDRKYHSSRKGEKEKT